MRLNIKILLPLLCVANWVYGQSENVRLIINTDKSFQTIEHFGASDAWACQFVGNWPDAKKNAIADLLFSLDTARNGAPKGIGLSLWRFNAGAGSTQQAEASGIKDEWRRAESFLDNNGHYDWSRQAGQVWFLKAARARRVPHFLCFSNSAPVNFTNNGKAFTIGGKTNLSADGNQRFADYLTELVSTFDKKLKIHFDYVSPVNEPQWDWSDGGQEGSPFKNSEIAALVKEINARFEKGNVTAKILVPEAGSIEYLYKTGDKPGKGNEISDFFKPGSAAYIGNLRNVAPAIAAHSYFTTSPFTKGEAMRNELADSVSKIPGLKFWQSEYCILGDNAGEINGSKRDLGIVPALYLARVVQMDLTKSNATSWQWWTAISPYDYKDGLIYVDKQKTDGNFYTSKMLWAFGNYARFIRPGAVRIDASINSATAKDNKLLVSAFRNGKDFTAVIVNSGQNSISLKLDSEGKQIHLLRSYITTDNKELEPKILRDKQTLTIDPQSITTITGYIN
ncbi:glycoside hydrolase family 30 protein [Mucilaginibacter agri]|uniref:Xylanase n=1 Tax=Mucilaginibacter agri TaxID=2695265 RepID=A0A965ZJQ7_9SPHI|nr:glycoside hydrolase family 30 protein [Mucilaginibacter agri]NCD72439.1 xylanase [Mucilaginibacter agri]